MKVRWVDLSRFGATLQILPKAPCRPLSLTILTIRDSTAFQKPWFADANEDAKSVRGRFKQVLADMGFDYDARRPLPYDDRTNQTPIQMVSQRTKYSLVDLQSLCPGLTADDMRQMEPQEFVMEAEIADESLEAWTMYIAEQAGEHAESKVGTVWMPKEQPFAASYEDSLRISGPEILPDRLHPMLNRSRLVSWQVTDSLNDHYYRSNALTLFYATKEHGVAAGHAADDLQEIQLPHALPFRVREDNGIVAIADVRQVPEAMYVAPDRVSDDTYANLLKTLRKADGVRLALQGEIPKWRGWGDQPDTLQNTALVHQSLQAIVDALWGTIQTWRPARCTLRDMVVFEGTLDAAARTGRLPDRLPVKDLRKIAASDLWELRGLFYDYGALNESDIPASTCDGWINTVFQRVTELLSSEARAAASAELHRTAKTLLADEASDDAEPAKHKHEDAGEHIGGARKDFARRAMTLEDFEAMNTLEREALVQKKNIWPPLDYQAMRERGVSADAAYAIKMLKDALPTRPYCSGRSHDGNEQRQACYIEAITTARDKLNQVKALEDIPRVLAGLYVYAVDDVTSRWITNGTRKQVQLGSKFCRLTYAGWNYGDEPRIPYDVIRTLRRKVGDDPDNWAAMIKPKRERSDTEKAEAKAKTKADKELHRPHLAHVEREGEDWRQGVDVTAEDLMDRFGFRAVEFGNWLPQDERQDVLNMTYDSFADLADVLELPPSAMSFDGDLAVAFGSRGSGGRSAALAHYEPERRVINLTRMKGAGCLAHEWTHAWDFHLGKGRSIIEHVPPRTPIADLATAMRKGSPDLEVLHDRCWDEALRGRDNVYSWLYYQPDDERPHLKEVNNALFEAVRGKFERDIDNCIEGYCAGRFHYARAAIGYGTIADVVDDVMAKIKNTCSSKPGFTKVKSKIEGNLMYAFDKLATVCTIEAAEKAGLTLPPAFLTAHAGPTKFQQNAEKLDKMRSKPYWSTSCEMLARASAAYVSDELERRGARNDYLVYGAEASRHADNPLGNPNPADYDREVLAEHFGKVWEAYRLDYLSQREPTPSIAVGS